MHYEMPEEFFDCVLRDPVVIELCNKSSAKLLNIDLHLAYTAAAWRGGIEAVPDAGPKRGAVGSNRFCMSVQIQDSSA